MYRSVPITAPGVVGGGREVEQLGVARRQHDVAGLEIAVRQ
jgi:hypothetical protein